MIYIFSQYFSEVQKFVVEVFGIKLYKVIVDM